MAALRATFYTDPADPWSWALEPSVRRLQVEFGASVAFTYVMGGLAREIADPVAAARNWLEAGARSGMPVDLRLWLDGPPRSTYPACLAVKAASEQGDPAPYLRRLREGFALRGRKLDTTEALVEEARATPGLDVERFRIDLASNAIVELFGADLERLRAKELSVPALELGERTVRGWVGYEELREAVLAAGAEPAGAAAPPVEDALRRFGAMAPAEVAAACRLPGPRAPAELWALAAEWRAREDGGLFTAA
ncbi:MAG TPA: DsbA family protein [Solirubrobacteraceae bacterium]|nr:DsbA family protein [Solirubrobacteraceae bacterium]